MKQTQNETGVYPACRKDGSTYYRASVTYRGKHISLGSFEDSRMANAAYRRAQTILRDSSVTLLNYSDDSPLLFEKWVILINFRDSGLYFGKPILLGQRMFFYYLEPQIILKFDLDDLFYYSSHKIMHRGNHFFVADYGMQVSIVSRYGIKPYAVEGKDYQFINGDRLDFRRQNLRILNTYHGVLHNPRKECYTARIHLNGYTVIGHYATALEAALAYNKAIDILKKSGVTKAYQPNYIEGLSPRVYADLYSKIKISQSILEYRPQASL